MSFWSDDSAYSCSVGVSGVVVVSLFVMVDRKRERDSDGWMDLPKNLRKRVVTLVCVRESACLPACLLLCSLTTKRCQSTKSSKADSHHNPSLVLGED